MTTIMHYALLWVWGAPWLVRMLTLAMLCKLRLVRTGHAAPVRGYINQDALNISFSVLICYLRSATILSWTNNCFKMYTENVFKNIYLFFKTLGTFVCCLLYLVPQSLTISNTQFLHIPSLNIALFLHLLADPLTCETYQHSQLFQFVIRH